MQRADVREIVVDTLSQMSQVFKDKGVTLDARLPERVAPVQVDVDRLLQVLLNLLSNALKFVPARDGKVEVILSEQPGFVRVDVRDNGPGIRKEDQPHVFDKFRQFGDNLTGKPPGTGLGLYISRQIIEYFGGRLWVESRFGAGACFSFSLPTVAASRSNVSKEPA
jgi:signal transduction histidine kinase